MTEGPGSGRKGRQCFFGRPSVELPVAEQHGGAPAQDGAAGPPSREVADGTVLVSVLTRILAEWTAPDFLTAVAAREGVDLDPGAITMVTILANSGPQRPSRLAADMVTGASNISKILARLITAGLARRIADPTDARAQLVELTASGQRTAAALVRAGDGLVDELFAGWTEPDRKEFTRLLARFGDATTALSGRLRHATWAPGAPPPP